MARDAGHLTLRVASPRGGIAGISRSIASAVVVVALLAGGGCGGSRADDEGGLVGSQWEMVAVRGPGGMEPAAPTTIATLVFEATTASGSDGCNRYRFDYSVDAASLAFADLSITGASCDADRAGQGELVIDALADTRHFARREGHLELTSAHGAVLAEFRPAEPLLLEGVSWRLTGLDGDEGGLITPVGGVSLAFDAVGRLVGVSGCNDYSADYTARGSELVLTGIAATERSCANPPGVMAFEAGYLASLPRVASFSTSLTELTLRDSDGETVAEYRFGGRTR